jgi:hypothetical protein
MEWGPFRFWGICGEGTLERVPQPWEVAFRLYFNYTSCTTRSTMVGVAITRSIERTQLTTVPVDLTLLLTQQETKYHEPRRSPPGTTIHTLRARQQQIAPSLGVS